MRSSKFSASVHTIPAQFENGWKFDSDNTVEKASQRSHFHRLRELTYEAVLSKDLPV